MANWQKTTYIHVRATDRDRARLAELAEKLETNQSEAARRAIYAALEAAKNQPQPQAEQAN